MGNYTSLGVNDFLNQAAARVPSPGGGCVTALVGCLSCSMARMAVIFSDDNRVPEAARRQVEMYQARLERADQVMRRLLQEDAEAYQTLQETARRASHDESAMQAHNSAALTAISVPTEMAATAAEILSLIDEFKVIANKNLLSEVGISAVLADATARAARYCVLANLPELCDMHARDAAQDQINRIITRCGQLCASIHACVHNHMRALEAERPCGVS